MDYWSRLFREAYAWEYEGYSADHDAKTAVLAADSMVLDQEDTKAAQGVARSMAAEAYSLAESVKKFEA